MKSIFVLCYAACFLLLGADATRRLVWFGGSAQDHSGRRIEYDDAGYYFEDQIATPLPTNLYLRAARIGVTIPQAINGQNVVRFTFYGGRTPGIYPVATVTNEDGPINRGSIYVPRVGYRSFRVEAFARRPIPIEPVVNEALRDPARQYYTVDIDRLIGDPYRLNEIHKIQHRDLGKWEAVEGTPSGCNDVGSAGDAQPPCVSSYVKAPDVPDTDCNFAVVCCYSNTLSVIAKPTREVISQLQLKSDCTVGQFSSLSILGGPPESTDQSPSPSPKTDWTYAENTGGLNDKPLMNDCKQVVTNLQETAKNDEASLCHAAIWGSCAASVTQVHGDPNCGDLADVVNHVITTFYTNPGYPNGGWTGGSATGLPGSENDGLFIDVNKVPGVTTFSGEG